MEKNQNSLNLPEADPERRRPVRSRGIGRIVIFSVLSAILLSLIITAGYVILHKPTADNEIPFDTSPNLPDKSDPENDGEPDGPERLNKFNFLVMGRDRVGFNTDVIMLVSYDMDNGTISVMQIPRDTYLELDGYPEKINSVFAMLYSDAYKRDEEDPIDAGMKEFVNVLQSAFSIKIDYYAMVNLQGFRDIIDIIGGVDIYVPRYMDYEDPDQGLSIHLAPGQQTLTGAQSEQFVRFRSGYLTGDIGRVEAQKIFLSALMSTLKSKVNASNVVDLVRAVFDNLSTDIPLQDMIYFAKEALGVDLSQAVFMTMPGEAIRYYGDSGLWFYIVHRHEMIGLINRFFNVFDFEIDEEIFDADKVLNDDRKSYFNAVYYYEDEDEDLDDLISSAEHINEEGLPIA